MPCSKNSRPVARNLETRLKATHEPGADDGIDTVAPKSFPRFDLVRGHPGLLTQEPDQITLHIFQYVLFRVHVEPTVS